MLPPSPATSNGQAVVALVGNPNAGKTSLFNALTGLRAKTANFPGTTVEHRGGKLMLSGQQVELVDLPGLYTLAAATPEERIARDALIGAIPGQPRPSVVLLIVDATNLERNLFLASQVLELGLPTVVALNMSDLAHRAGIHVDPRKLGEELCCPVVATSAVKNKGIDELRRALEARLDEVNANKPVVKAQSLVKACSACGSCPFESRYSWAESIGKSCATTPVMSHGQTTEKLDRIMTHPVVGVLLFFAIMFVVFAMIFWVAQYPMGWIDQLFGYSQHLVSKVVPPGDVRSLLAQGVVGGVGGMLVFLPQICILFFFLSLLEDTGYLSRAAFVMDRLMRRVGLPGKAFVPMISAHACAIPAIMSTRVIEDKRDRLVTMLVLPLFSCSARIPVYVMVTALLFPHDWLKAAMVFTGAYSLGIVAALTMAAVFKGTILKGESRPLVIELPSYKVPSLRNAFLMMADRALIFVKNAGTVILLISVILWALSTYPKSAPPPEALVMQEQAAHLTEMGDSAQAEELANEADHLISQSALANSFAGRIGHVIEPVIQPLGYDWQIGVGVLSSFAAREVIVSTLAVVYGVGEDATEDNPQPLYDKLRNAKRSDGSPVFTTATCLSVLVFYVLAMQCLPTQAVTKRETGTWKWPLFQLAYMTALAYCGALVTYQVALMLT
ncbi:MAG: ferrous iron transport protein B [Phycisphaera sp.]|nr:ferrous iron transport protein B [Phycisphaera sp.]